MNRLAAIHHHVKPTKYIFKAVKQLH
jgi:hypothetical protein